MDRWRAGAYFITQGVVGILWWVLLYSSTTVRDWFVADAGWPVARSLVVADVVAFGLGSIVAGVAVLQRRQWAGGAVVALTAVTAYATLVAAAWVAAPVDRWLGLVAMSVALGVTAVSARWVLEA